MAPTEILAQAALQQPEALCSKMKIPIAFLRLDKEVGAKALHIASKKVY